MCSDLIGMKQIVKTDLVFRSSHPPNVELWKQALPTTSWFRRLVFGSKLPLTRCQRYFSEESFIYRLDRRERIFNILETHAGESRNGTRFSSLLKDKI